MNGRRRRPRPRIVLIGCGASKLDREAPAAALYNGAQFKLAYSAAAEIAPGRVWILSALHGLVRPWQRLAPYDLKMGQPGSVTAATIRLQAEHDGILQHRVLALCSAAYADIAVQVWAEVERPLAHLGIGEQRHVLATLRDEAAAGLSRRPGLGYRQGTIPAQGHGQTDSCEAVPLLFHDRTKRR